MLKVKAETIYDIKEEQERIEKEFSAIDNAYVEIGVLGDAGDAVDADGNETGISLALIASVHEYGSPKRKIPERSFILSTMTESAGKFNEATNSLIGKIVDGAISSKDALSLLGLMIQTAIKKKIQSNIPPALAQSTIDQKNRAHINKAKGVIKRLTDKSINHSYRQAQKKIKGGKGPVNEGQFDQSASPFLNERDKSALNKAANKVITGGSSTALIDTGQLINSIKFQTFKEGAQGTKMGGRSAEEDA